MKKAISILLSVILIISALISEGIVASASETDSAYNNDISNLQYITSIKNQGDYGNCWAFAAIACCEAEAVKNHGASITDTDLSEHHLVYFSYNGERSSGDTVTAVEPYYTFGGFSHLPIFTLSSWIGLVDEDVAKYSDFTANPSISLNPDLMYGNNKYYLTNAYTYSLPDEIDEVKEAILTYGAVQTSYCSSDDFLNKGNYRNKIYAHYCPTAYASDHAVAIVGWDDNYSKDNFKSSARPQNNGAWLVKNSWGNDWGLDGYFWLSYEDKSAIEAIAFDVTPAKDAYDNNYYHDGGLSRACMTEVDLIETMGSQTWFASNVHRWGNDGVHNSMDGVSKYLVKGNDKRVNIDLERENGDMTENFHTYSMYWDDECMKFAFDGKTYVTYDFKDEESVSVHCNMNYINLHFRMGDASYGRTWKEGEHPEYVEAYIDSIKVYQTDAINSQMMYGPAQYSENYTKQDPVIMYPDHPITASY